MRFFRDGCVTDFCSCKIGIPYVLYISSVLTKTLGAFLGSFAARRVKTKDGFYPILD
jgi:hypothetical protein